MAKSDWKVHKFGGSSLADADCFRRVAAILLEDQAPRQAVVVSAMGQMTDALLGLVTAAEGNQQEIEPGLEAIRSRYQATVNALMDSEKSIARVLDVFETELSDAADLLQAISLVRVAPDRSRDLVAGYGELWSTRLLGCFLEQQCGENGRPIKWVDARTILVIDRDEMGPAVCWEESGQNAANYFRDDTVGIVVMTGYIASDPGGLHTTLGRNGSDFSASILAALLNAESITIWTDVDGVMSADPNRVPDATVIEQLSYNEAMELAYFGAKVIHPQTMAPAISHTIPIYIRNTFNTNAGGSRIGSFELSDQKIKGITTVDDVALLNLEGAGMIGVPGTADRLFSALRTAGISVILISQASSEHSICFAVPSSDAGRAEDAITQAFSTELEQGQIQSIGANLQCSIVAVVGDGMAGLPGVAARFFNTLSNAGINIRAIAQGSSERNISAVVERKDVTRALRAAHSGFYLSASTISVGLIGPGHVGSVLLSQMAQQMSRLQDEFSLDFRIRGIATSSRMLLADKRVDLENWRSLLDEYGEPLDWERFAEHVNADHLPHAVMVDCSASEQVASRYLDWFRSGIHVVTPNKKAHSGSLEFYDQLYAERRQHGAYFLYETTVGAALPVIDTLRHLRETGDVLECIDGIFSGTLAYLFNVFDGSTPFSTIVSEARDSGYTEPDPRDDLSGMDVARKLIILGREMGMRLSLEDLEIESLVPEKLQDGAIEDFLVDLAAYDEQMLDRWQAADDNGNVLRYVGRLDSTGGGTVRLEALPANHIFANMNLTDNIVRFASQRYNENALVVQGPGAGPEVTASGVFADLLRLAAYLGASR